MAQPLTNRARDNLREQKAIGDEISTAITSGVGTEVDEDELENELGDLQQEMLDEKMLKTGNVPVHDRVGRLPQVPTDKGKAQIEEEEDEELELLRLQAEMAS